MIENEYPTADIILAACLKMEGYQIVRIEKNNNKGTFIFENVEKQLIEDFDFGKMRVEPVAFNQAIRSLTTAVRRIN